MPASTLGDAAAAAVAAPPGMEVPVSARCRRRRPSPVGRPGVAGPGTMPRWSTCRRQPPLNGALAMRAGVGAAGGPGPDPQAKRGALMVVGDDPAVLSICTGGFLLDAEFTPHAFPSSPR